MLSDEQKREFILSHFVLNYPDDNLEEYVDYVEDMWGEALEYEYQSYKQWVTDHE